MTRLKWPVCILSLTLAANVYAANTLRYTLMPGSTITPTYYGDPAGSTEPLTGSLSTQARFTFFAGTVDVKGLGTTVCELSSGLSGTYSGSRAQRESLNYRYLSMAPAGGGSCLADVTLFAVLTEVLPDVDNDQDGVLDDVDSCWYTAPGSVVDSQGCSIDQRVPCAGPASGGTWKNHGEYVSATVEVAKTFLSEGLIDHEEEVVIVTAAAQSNCGGE